MIENFIQKIKKNQKILVAYSGGLDSTVLLYQLIPFTMQYPFIQLRSIHINHQNHLLSNNWSKHCKKICKKNNIPISIYTINFKNQKNFQSTARKIRYNTIKKHLHPNEILVTGHHINDQIETFFLSLKRKSGPMGVSGIKKNSIFYKKHVIIRPLINYTKNQIKKWAKLHNISWIEDDSNTNNKYERNFIRNNIINPIQKKWPFFIKNCISSMKFCANQEKSLNFFLDSYLEKYVQYNHSIQIDTIKKFIKEIQILVIRRWILLYSNNIISYKITQNIYQNILHNQNSNINKKIIFNNYQIFCYKNYIFQIPIYKNIKNTILFWNNCKQPLKLPENLGIITQNKYGTKIPKPKKNDLVNIRFQCNKKVLIHQKYTKSIKNIWQENKILPWYRNKIPLLFYNNKLICIIGLINIYTIQKNNTNYWTISWINNYLK
ncbi:tRNA(Ile)-lysidine synthase [Buchnera aphidicola (Pterocallis alni)]|uniref:tRNA lysidine(34) synthetase TilS n=1 Tax=Buchnera aphidicola TaxID=9 RepID=UPI003464D2F7